jgi:CheY-like chemotaxis protein
MDLKMPEMDGIEATREISRRIDPTVRPLVVALTANATAEDREACFRAGMVDFMSKPLQLDTLHATLSRAGEFVESAGKPARTRDGVLAGGDAVARAWQIEDPVDEDTLRELAVIFRDQLDTCLAKMREAIAANRPDALTETAHLLKGSAGVFGASRLAKLCQEVEKAGRDAALERAAKFLERLEEEAEAFKKKAS